MRSPIFVFLALAAIYMVPGLVAVIRRRPDQWLILMSNLLFGWTVVGWIGALAWACRRPRPVAARKAAKVRKPEPAERAAPLASPAARRRRMPVGRTAYQWDDLEGRDQYAAWLEQNDAGARHGRALKL